MARGGRPRAGPDDVAPGGRCAPCPGRVRDVVLDDAPAPIAGRPGRRLANEISPTQNVVPLHPADWADKGVFTD